jgi:hypothetical protein
MPTSGVAGYNVMLGNALTTAAAKDTMPFRTYYDSLTDDLALIEDDATMHDDDYNEEEEDIDPKELLESNLGIEETVEKVAKEHLMSESNAIRVVESMMENLSRAEGYVCNKRTKVMVTNQLCLASHDVLQEKHFVRRVQIALG